MSDNKIAIVNYEVGNILSIQRCLEKINCKSYLISNPNDLDDFDKIILPGVGRFDYVMNKLNDLGFSEKLLKKNKHRARILGICVGMQVFFESSEESIKTAGLCFIKGRVKKILINSNIKAPHIGWNKVYMNKENSLSNKYYYFVHSYSAMPQDQKIITGFAYYGNNKITSSIKFQNLFGTQFHPEKSSTSGLDYLNYFIKNNE